MTLTKSDIVDSISNHVGFTRRQSIKTVEALLEIMKKTFEVIEKAAKSDALIIGIKS